MAGDDLSTWYFLWATAYAFGLGAVTLIDSKRKALIWSLWAICGAFVLAAGLWPFADRWPTIKAVVEGISAHYIAVNLLGLTILSLLFLDFRHRSKKARAEIEKPGVSADAGPLLNRLEEVEGQIKNLNERFFELSELVPRDLDKALEQKTKELIHLDKNMTRNNQKLLWLDRDIPILMEIILEQLSLSLLFSSIPETPQFSKDFGSLTRDLLGLEYANAKAYIGDINRILSNTQWGMNTRSIVANSQVAGEHALRQTQQENRPQSIDTLDLRNYMIAKVTCESLSDYIKAERREAATKYLSYLHRLREQLEQLRAFQKQ